MLEAIKRLLVGQAEPAAPEAAAGRAAETTGATQTDDQRLRVAACALLLEIAQADDEFSDEERHHVEEVLQRHFDVPAEEAHELMAVAEVQRREAVDLYQFTSVITTHYDEGQRLLLAELLWRVVYADGELSKHEDYLMRTLAILLDLRPGYLAAARKRAAPDRAP